LPKRTTRSRRSRINAEEEELAVRPFWSGTISFGLVSVPVDLFPATRKARSSLRMLGPDGVPLSRRYYSPDTNKDLEPEETVRGYEVQKDKFVAVTDEELERLEPDKARDIDVRQFVKAEEISPAYSEHAYYLAPGRGSIKAYQLLAEIMQREGRAGIATFVMRGKEYLVAIFAEHGILEAITMRFSDELRSPKDIGLPKPKAPGKSSVQRLEKIIQRKSSRELSREELVDKQTEALLGLIEKKRTQRKDIVETEAPKGHPEKVVDLMEVLKRSLARQSATKRRAA